jgi:hypothetical protein
MILDIVIALFLFFVVLPIAAGTGFAILVVAHTEPKKPSVPKQIVTNNWRTDTEKAYIRKLNQAATSRYPSIP